MSRKDAFHLLKGLVSGAIATPEETPDRLVILSLSEERSARLLTPKRIELLELIREAKPDTMGELASLSNRPLEAVSRDLHQLAAYGVVELVKKGRAKQPVVVATALVIPMHETTTTE